MKALLDLFPVVIFFAVYYISGKSFVISTLSLIVATCLQVFFIWLRERKVEKLPLYSALLVLIFGGISISFHDPKFLQWKPTFFYWAIALTMLGGQMIGKNLTRKGLSALYVKSGVTLGNVPSTVWLCLNLVAIFFLVLIGALNWYIAFHFSFEFWVNFKLFGLSLSTVIAFFILSVSLSPYIIDSKRRLK